MAKYNVNRRCSVRLNSDCVTRFHYYLLVTAYYNYVNRLADGLGVELEAFWVGEELTMDETYFREAAEHRRARREGRA